MRFLQFGEIYASKCAFINCVMLPYTFFQKGFKQVRTESATFNLSPLVERRHFLNRRNGEVGGCNVKDGAKAFVKFVFFNLHGTRQRYPVTGF